MNVRQEASIILGVPIGVGGWDKVFADLEVLGKMDQAKVNKLIAMCCKRMEELEDASIQSDR